MNYLLCQGERDLALYLTEQRRIFRVPQSLRSAAEMLLAAPEVSQESSNGALVKLHQALQQTERPLASPVHVGRLRRVSLNVTNACNMACRYCYANEGEYGSPRSLMSEETARRAIDVLFRHYSQIEAVQFFGGEPLMNPRAILAACEHLEGLRSSGVITQMPTLGLVTNGTVLNRRVETILRVYKPAVTISIDGPASVHDAVRVMKNDRGSFDRIVKNAGVIADLIGRPIGIEVTWSAAQEQVGLSVHELVMFLRSTFNTEAVHVAPVSLPEGHPYRPHGFSCFAASVPEFTDDLRAGRGRAFLKYESSLRAFAKGFGSDVFCDAGLGVLAVSGNGEVYPCFMFIDEGEFLMGNIADPDLFNSDRFCEVTEKFARASKRESEQCGTCPLRPVCSGCLGANYFETGSPFRVSQDTCRSNFEFNEAMLVAVSGA